MRGRILLGILITALFVVTPWAWADKGLGPQGADLFDNPFDNPWATADDEDAEDDEGTTADEQPADVAWTWFEQLYDVVKAQGTPPPQASRIYGITAVALHESIVAGTEHNRSLAGQLNGLASVPQPDEELAYHWPTVANTALADTIRGVFPSLSPASLTAINNLEQSFATEFQAEVPQSQYDRSVAHGQAVADAILDWAATDGLAVHNDCPYVPQPVPGAWQPTPPAFQPNPLQPCWGQIRPMVLTSGAECPPAGHPAFSTDTDSDFYAAGLEVYNVDQGLTAEQETIADYWADGPGATGTPPGHWIAIASQISRNDELSLAAAAGTYARVGIAVHDAFIECWFVKYQTNLQRPVTYIRDNIDPGFTPYIATPPFPTYTSGHSTQSGAAAGALTDMFGTKSFTDTTHTDHNLVPALAPRTFDSFDEAADEAAVSRLYGGIHYTFDNDDGLGSGQCIWGTIDDRVNFGDEDDEDDEGDDDESDDDESDDDHAIFGVSAEGNQSGSGGPVGVQTHDNPRRDNGGRTTQREGQGKGRVSPRR